MIPKLRLIRIEKQMTMRSLWVLTGFSPVVISGVERGETEAPDGFFEKCATALGVDVSILREPDLQYEARQKLGEKRRKKLCRETRRIMRQGQKVENAMRRYRRRQKRRQAASPRGKRLIPIQNINIYMYMNGAPHLIGHADKGTIRPKGSW